MSLLYFLEGIRTPVLDQLFSLITHFGEETLVLVVGLLLFWCVSKREGYYILCVGMLGLVINQIAKMLFRIPRPWVRDPNFTIVERSRAAAGDYSFPSGHTQTGIGLYGAILRWSKRRSVRIVCLILCVLIPFSRMYLGVHTPLDVGFSAVLAFTLVFVLYPILHDSCDDPSRMRPLLGLMALLAVSYVAFMQLYSFPSDVDTEILAFSTRNAYSICGSVLALWLTWELDSRYIHFKTQASLPAQAVKLAVGYVLVLALKGLLKYPLQALLGGHPAANLLRYFVTVVFAGSIWPLAFPWLCRRFPAASK